MQKLKVCSLATLGGALVLAACHNQPHSRHGAALRDNERAEARHARANDRDLDHDESVDESRQPDVGVDRKAKRAVHAISQARCEREQRCDNIGPDKSYASLDACLAKIESEWGIDLNKYECPRGIVKTELDQCLVAVRGEECGNPFDTLSRIAQCDADDICEGD